MRGAHVAAMLMLCVAWSARFTIVSAMEVAREISKEECEVFAQIIRQHNSGQARRFASSVKWLVDGLLVAGFWVPALLHNIYVRSLWLRVLKLLALFLCFAGVLAGLIVAVVLRARTTSYRLHRLRIDAKNFGSVYDACKDSRNVIMPPRPEKVKTLEREGFISDFTIIVLAVLAVIILATNILLIKGWRSGDSSFLNCFPCWRRTPRAAHATPAETTSQYSSQSANSVQHPKRDAQSLFAHLPRITIDNDKVKADDVCAICLCELNVKSITELPCEHYFHRTCVTNWLNKARRPACPLCKTPVSPQRTSST